MGRTPYQAAQRLLAIAQAHWAEIDSAYYQVDLISFPFDRFLNCIYAWVVQRFAFDPEGAQKREEFDTMLNAPTDASPATAKYQFSDEEAGASFMTALGSGG